jgi:mannose-P-dolichol utilization defect protein 1
VRENYRNKSTGNLSFLTVVLNFGGNIARTFTVLTEAGNDIIFLISNALPIVVNGIILLQFILYWNNTITPQSAKQ